ncbi:MAG: protein kinase [Gemmatimonadota bacterium]
MSTAKVCLQCGSEYDGSTLFCPRDGSALKLVDPGSALIGQVVADRFLVHKELGKGGMGQVFLAEQVRIGRRCALKVIREGLVSDPDSVLRFNREASNAASISHPNVVQVYDFGESRDGMIFLAMEYVDGESLGALLAREGTVAPLRAVSIASRVASALTAAHDLKIVHRDLKPDNVMLARNRDGSDLVKVVDFGVARVMDSADQKVTGTGLVIGTPEYMSPEQFTGKGIDGRSDLYSLALILFRMLTGTPVFDAENAREALDARFSQQPKRLAAANPHVAWPAGLQEVMDRGMALRVDDRYQTVDAFAEAVVAVTSYWNPDEGARAEGGPVSASHAVPASPGAPSGASRAPRRAPAGAPSPEPVVGGATAALSANVPPSPPSVELAQEVAASPGRRPARAVDRSSAGARTSAVAADSDARSASKRGPVVWAIALVAVVVTGVYATRGLRERASLDAPTASPSTQSASPTAPSQGSAEPPRRDSAVVPVTPVATPASDGSRIAAGGTAKSAGRASDGAATTTSPGSSPVTPPDPRASDESAESAVVRGQLARLKTLTDSSASSAQAREALRLAKSVSPTTRDGRVELKYRSLEANILLDETAAICSLLSQLRFEAKGTRFEEAVSAYAVVARESCP